MCDIWYIWYSYDPWHFTKCIYIASYIASFNSSAEGRGGEVGYMHVDGLMVWVTTYLQNIHKNGYSVHVFASLLKEATQALLYIHMQISFYTWS